MEYNTTREKLRIPAYGRNVQKMIEEAIKIEDREIRNRAAQAIVKIMAQINPTTRDSGDYQRTLWDHMIIISDFRLDVDGPYPPPSREVLEKKPEKIEYGNDKITYRHYGKNIEAIIKKAIDFPEGEEKKALIRTIANHLKKSYIAWNRESVSDATIFKHLRELSGGKLEIPEDLTLISTSEIISKNKQKRSKSHQQRRSNNGKKKNYGQRSF
ncbi:MAG: DUF4290 domain-containing protein [Chlorobi bacterium]|nr:DUF4290 domain-containing protein [Chlorobiota bacterium]